MTFINRKTNGQFPGRKKRETNGIRPMRTEMSEKTIHYWVYIVLIFLTFSLICYITWLIFGLSFFLKIGLSIGGRALSFALVKCGLSGGLAWAIGCVLRALFSAEEMPLWMYPSGADAGSGSGDGAGGRGFRWTDLFGNSSTGNSETGGNSVSSSEPSINQPAPHSPEPVAPEVDRGRPLIPEDENDNHLMPAQARLEELAHRLSINSIQKNLSREEWGSIITAQIVVEESIEAALVDNGYPAAAILAKRHQIRGFMFYPGGTSLTEKTYVGYVRSIDNLGTHASVPYKRVIQAIRQHNLSL
ncbi:unnamed protein product [Vicia faba]|uniref:Uncharacterized protein n=1 Tax=Vicia faba TaxID=3906 RepID=A0AAV1AFM7_VICFA|nr:unnamed protein product [Vicia faba]